MNETIGLTLIVIGVLFDISGCIGLVRLPDPEASFGPGNLVGLPPGTQLACLAETVLMALEGSREHHVGRDGV